MLRCQVWAGVVRYGHELSLVVMNCQMRSFVVTVPCLESPQAAAYCFDVVVKFNR